MALGSPLNSGHPTSNVKSDKETLRQEKPSVVHQMDDRNHPGTGQWNMHTGDLIEDDVVTATTFSKSSTMNQNPWRASITYEHTSFRADICGLNVSLQMAYRTATSKYNFMSLFRLLKLVVLLMFRTTFPCFLMTSKCLNQWRLEESFQVKRRYPTWRW
jgi:hypothetical protein